LISFSSSTIFAGALVGGNIAEEIVPVSIADLFVVRRKVWIEFQRKTHGVRMGAGAGGVGFKESRAGMRLGDFRGSEKGIGKIKETPEGQFEYTADLTFAFANRRREVITDKSAPLRSERKLASNELSEPNSLEGTINGNYEIKYHNRNSVIYHEQRENRRKLYGAKITSEREEMISNLQKSTVFPFTTDVFESTPDDKRAIKVHELSFLDMMNGVATTQHLVQVEVEAGQVKGKVSVCPSR
jgi:hypothetical protein